MKTFAVTIPTRDRPHMFREALDSVLAQNFSDYEVIVVDDGSNDACRAELEVIKSDVGDKVRWLHLQRREKGHGHPFARNTAAAAADARYICTLDDDDTWIDPNYLAKLADILGDSSRPEVDAVFSNQKAYRGSERIDRPLWLDRLNPYLEKSGRKADMGCAFSVSLEDILAASTGFCHLNNLVLRSDFYERLGGLDETLRYEPDRDVFLRVIDAAAVMAYLPDYVSRHNVPDPKKNDNVSTQVNVLQKKLIQLRVLGKSAFFSQSPALRDHSALRRSYVLREVSNEMISLGRHRDAVRYSIEAYGASPSLKGGLYALYMAVTRGYLLKRNE